MLNIKKIIASGEIGTVASGWGQWGFAINPEAPSSAWKLNKELGGGGTFSDNGIHVVDFILGLFGEPERAIGVSRLDGFQSLCYGTAGKNRRDGDPGFRLRTLR